MINCLHYNINQMSKNVSFSHIFVNFINIVFSHKKQPGKIRAVIKIYSCALPSASSADAP